MAIKEYKSYDALALAELVRKKEVTPLELIDTAIDEIEATNHTINAVIYKNYENAREIARHGKMPKGPFYGVPFLLKDLIVSYKDLPLTSGSRYLKSYIPDHHSELVLRHLNAGLIILGKTNTPEFGLNVVTEPTLFGATHNPWHTKHTTGGSSGGSAAAVAAGYVPMAHGGDGGGSIRIPASCCGVFGFKPSRGRTPTGPDFGRIWQGSVVEHALTRSVRDSAALLDATTGPDLGANDWLEKPATSFLSELSTPPAPLRIALAEGNLFKTPTHPDCIAAVQQTAKLCESLGHHVEIATPQIDPEKFIMAYLTVVAGEMAGTLKMIANKFGKKPTRHDLELPTHALAHVGRILRADDFAQAASHLQLLSRKLAGFFTQYDVLLTPTLAQPPLKTGALSPTSIEKLALHALPFIPSQTICKKALRVMAEKIVAYTPWMSLFNATGQPAMSLPLMINKNNLPIGSHFVGRYAEDALLFKLAHQLESASSIFSQPPNHSSTR